MTRNSKFTNDQEDFILTTSDTKRVTKPQRRLDNPYPQTLKKDPGVPKLNLKQKHVKLNNSGSRYMALDPSISTLAAASHDIHVPETSENLNGQVSDPTLAAHAHQFKKVLEMADVILQVLDARDPLGCRSKILEEEIIRSGSNKKIILVLNKTDLVPKPNVQAWLKYLRQDFPTIPFKSSTQTQRTNLSSSGTSKSGSRGASSLLHLLKSIRPAHSSITVGVLGPPNVGKSSLINSIKRGKVCTVGAKPGETRALKEVAVERGIKVIDSPGIVWGDDAGGGEFRNVWGLESLEDPVLTAEGIISRVEHNFLRETYGTPEFRNAAEFLTMVSLVRGKLGKGGKPDIEAAALSLIHDWNTGKIPYHTTPPDIHPSMAREGGGGGTSIVSSWGTAFDLDGLWDATDEDVLGDGEGDVPMEAIEENTEQLPENHPDAILPDSPAPILTSTPRPGSRARSPSLRPQVRERRPPKRPQERTQRLVPKGTDDNLFSELAAAANPLNAKRLRDEAKKRRKEAARFGGNTMQVEEDVEMA